VREKRKRRKRRKRRALIVRHKGYTMMVGHHSSNVDPIIRALFPI